MEDLCSAWQRNARSRTSVNGTTEFQQIGTLALLTSGTRAPYTSPACAASVASVALVARSPERKPLYQSAPPVRLCSHVCSLNATLTARLSPTAFFEKAKKHPSCVTNLARKFLRHNRTSTATACEATASPKRQQGVALMMQHTSAVGQP